MGASSHSAFMRQLQLAFVVGLAGAIAVVMMVGSTEKDKLHAVLGNGVTAARAAHPVAPAR